MATECPNKATAIVDPKVGKRASMEDSKVARSSFMVAVESCSGSVVYKRETRIELHLFFYASTCDNTVAGLTQLNPKQNPITGVSESDLDPMTISCVVALVAAAKSFVPGSSSCLLRYDKD
ncbi:hypothetical protein C1H46_002137 [Malus baccata]|uniref:Uncharacterized protein n=1 Tax=Malus baccata TaxID=106549 RepID=A0A540NME4_MALBA|nr:hypothetical protein C1H46_002137 [Malus baccata]